MSGGDRAVASVTGRHGLPALSASLTVSAMLAWEAQVSGLLLDMLFGKTDHISNALSIVSFGIREESRLVLIGH